MTKLNREAVEFFTLSLMRVTTGFIFLFHGTQKMLGAFGGIDGYGTAAHLVSPLWIAGMIEIVGGVLIVAGFFTRPAAFILCGEMAFIYYRHHARGIGLVLSGGAEIAILCCFILLFLSTAEAGPWSLDRVLRRRT